MPGAQKGSNCMGKCWDLFRHKDHNKAFWRSAELQVGFPPFALASEASLREHERRIEVLVALDEDVD